ncbi:hypothetical protein ACIQYS_18400 [Psychrobacillus sp. NPDC096426]|uniref:hypothetical protein n=1 Tax=Psychrobacillus sp. NPDC096426 TaxID=3364491 RepID=UPI0037FA3272
MRKNWSPYVWKLLWTVGLIVLLIISYKLELKVKNHVATTFQMLPIIWFQFIANFVLGIYLSLLFIKKWSVKWNWSLIVCVTIPLLIISIYLPIAITFVQNIAQDSNNYSVPFPSWLMKITTYGIPAIVAGLTLIIGLFSNTARVNNYK